MADNDSAMGASTYLASHLVPTVAQNGVARITLDADGVLNLLPGKLGECLALDLVASALGAEELGLAVARVPNPVHEEVGGEEEDEGKAGVRVHGRVVVGKVDGAVAVREGHTGHVPEDEHEAPLFVEDVPGRGGSATCTNKRVQRTKKKKKVQTHQDTGIISSPLQQAFAYRKCAMSKKHISGVT